MTKNHSLRLQANTNLESSQNMLRLEGITKSFPDQPHPTVVDFNLEIGRGDFVALLGPSGCGKTTLLRLIAGFEALDSGFIEISGCCVSSPTTWMPPEKRKIGFVFQDYALFPHLDVLHNVAFGITGLPRHHRIERAKEVIDLVGLTIFRNRYPSQLSGGQQQRVALARALAPEPALILLDEPFSNLDAGLRDNTRAEVGRILRKSGTTALLVTHDQEEAMTFADRLAVMRGGWVEQVGSPEEVYLRPRTAFVAKFLGTANFIHGSARGEVAETPLGVLELSQRADGPVLLSVRPEALVFDRSNGFPVEVISRAFKGHDLTYRCQLLGEHRLSLEPFLVQTGPNCDVRPGDRIGLRVFGKAVPLGLSEASPANFGRSAPEFGSSE
jgi:iron(III) transport system ATP-binding protein